MGSQQATLRAGYRFDGLASFFQRAAAVVTANESLNYYLYECRLSERNETEFRPKIQNFTFKVLSAEKQLDQLITEGFDLSADSSQTRRGLEKGAVAFLLFVDRELASRELVATNAEARSAIDRYPYKIDFGNGEACASEAWTNPKFRRLGLHAYVFYRAYDYLRENGVKTVRSIVWVDNIAAQKAHERFAPEMKKYARGRFLKILGLSFCKEYRL